MHMHCQLWGCKESLNKDGKCSLFKDIFLITFLPFQFWSKFTIYILEGALRDVIKRRPFRLIDSYRTTLIAQKVKLLEVDRRKNLILRRLINNNNNITIVSKREKNTSESKFQREKRKEKGEKKELLVVIFVFN